MISGSFYYPLATANIISVSAIVTGTHGYGSTFEEKTNTPPDIFTCAYCNTTQAKVKDIVVRAHKLEQIVTNCCKCGAPRTEKRNG